MAKPLSLDASGNLVEAESIEVDNLTVDGASVPADYISIRDEKIGAQGGSAVVGRNTRDLNTLTDAGSHCSLSSNQFTLDAGTYDIKACGAAYQTNITRLYLVRVSGAGQPEDVVSGLADFAPSGNYAIARLSGRFTIATSTTFELQQNMQSAHVTTGLGVASSGGGLEVYAQVELWKVN